MSRPLLRASLALLPLALAAAPAAAQDVTPTHVFEAPLILPPFDGSIVFGTLIAPPAGETIVKTEVHLEWTTDGTQSAALFGMHLDAVLAAGPSDDLVIVGADLGWGAAPGTWSGVVASDALNGTLVGGLFGFPPTVNLEMEAAGGGGLWGTLEPTTKIVYSLGPHAEADVPSISVSAGGAQTLSLTAGPTIGPGKLYLVAGSMSGTTPGVDVAGVHVPLNFDAYSAITVNGPNHGPFVNTLGALDGVGQATAQIALPPGSSPSFAGLALQHSMILIDPVTGGILSASNPVGLTLLP